MGDRERKWEAARPAVMAAVRAHRRVLRRTVAASVLVFALIVVALVGVLVHRTGSRADIADTRVAVPATDPDLSSRPVTAHVASGAIDERASGVVASVGTATGPGSATRPGPSADGPDVPPPDYPAGLDPYALTEVPAGWTSSTHDLVSGGLPRSYLMIRPPVKRGASLPVVMILHGRGLTPAAMERISHLLPVVGRAITVYPAGWQRSWNAGGCCGVAHRQGVDDTAFLSSVVHQVLTTQPDASSRRVYLVGYSNGGRMAMRVACADPGLFAGLAAVEAVPVAPCAGTVPLPTVLIASTGDPLLTIATDGPKKTMQGYIEPTVGQTVDAWRQLDGCSPAASSKPTGLVTATVWSNCQGQGRVQYDLYRGGSHRWPVGGPTTPSAQSLIASFLWGRGSATAST
jgi:polyhydroxybutyrate depolymerase